MQNLIKISTGEYPIPSLQFKSENTQTIFPKELTDEILSSYGYAIVNTTEKPSVGRFDTIEEGQPQFSNGKYYQTWNVIEGGPTKDMVKRERGRRLSQGFDYDFGDSRGVHTIGTTGNDMAGWDEVTKWAQSKVNLGKPNDTINISTETGFVVVTAIEWFSIIEKANDFRQPIWQAYFTISSGTIPEDFDADSRWP